MKFNINVIKLWFWRIGVIVALFLAIINYVDNRQQEYLIFKTTDQITKLVEFDKKENEINFNFLELIKANKK